MKLKKSLLFLLAPILITGCSNIQNIPKEENQKPKIDTVYVTKEVPAPINPLDTLKGNDAYVKAKEFFEKGQNFYDDGKDDSSKFYFNKGIKILSQANLSSDDYNFIDPTGTLNNLEQYKGQKEALENGIEVSKEEIANAENKFPMGEKFAERVAYYKKLYQTKQNKWFENSLERFLQYEPYLDSLGRQKNLPEVINFMYPVESGMINSAKSRVGAKGLGQFMTQTGKIWGLKILGYWYDEREDPLKALPTSYDYINFLISDLNNPNLAIAAYNWGESRILKQLERFNSFSYDELLEKKVLPRETLEHLPKIYAYMLLAKETTLKDPKKDPILEKLLTNDFDTVTIHHQTGFGVMSKILGISKDELKAYNPAYRFDATPPERIVNGEYAFEVRIPKGKKEEFIKELAKVKKRFEFEGGSYVIKKGDTLSGIARRFGVSLYELKKINGFPRVIYSGHKLIIPGK